MLGQRTAACSIARLTEDAAGGYGGSSRMLSQNTTGTSRRRSMRASMWAPTVGTSPLSFVPSSTVTTSGLIVGSSRETRGTQYRIAVVATASTVTFHPSWTSALVTSKRLSAMIESPTTSTRLPCTKGVLSPRHAAVVSKRTITTAAHFTRVARMMGMYPDKCTAELWSG